eukprot:TRINITY_DN2715_c0_g1_i1.p1 TRINITY_DN2715_c0_g1~~TRINITY_DN2715_c0_g1_i1.p1  ORF type:complete len:338 (+),score=62.47 TRINITY_DN2715_c0_g1_i1:166-1179(+)
MFGFPGFGGAGGGVFEANFRCYPVSFIDKDSAEDGDKIILPPSALDKLAALHIQYPMLFRVENSKHSRVTHCGVLEFIAEEGMVYMPYWMMQNLLLQEGDLVSLRNISLPKGTYVKIQPHTQDFIDISNPKAVLEKTLRGYTCLTKGDTFVVNYNKKKYYIDVIETKPGEAVSVVETDCEVDFAPPKDYQPPQQQQNGQINQDTGQNQQTQEAETAEDENEDDEDKFQAFVGTGRRLDGKPGSVVEPVIKKKSVKSDGQNIKQKPGSKSGKFVMGAPNRLAAKLHKDDLTQQPSQQPQSSKSSDNSNQQQTSKEKEQDKSEDQNGFKAFQGKANKLK